MSKVSKEVLLDALNQLEFHQRSHINIEKLEATVEQFGGGESRLRLNQNGVWDIYGPYNNSQTFVGDFFKVVAPQFNMLLRNKSAIE